MSVASKFFLHHHPNPSQNPTPYPETPPLRNETMADGQDPPAASKPDMAKPSDSAGSAPADGQLRDGRDFKNPRHSGHKRSRMGGKNKEKGRSDWE